MAVEVTAELNLDDANKAVNAFQKKAAKKIDDAAKTLGESFDAQSKKAKGSLDGVENSLRGVQDAAERTAKSTEKALSLDRVRDARDVFGDFKDIVEFSIAPLAGLNEEMTDQIVLAGDMAEKGSAIGLVFGPLAGIIGGVVAGAVGFFAAEAKEANERIEDQIKRVTSLSERLRDLAETTRETGRAERSLFEELSEAERELFFLRKELRELEVEIARQRALDGAVLTSDLDRQKQLIITITNAERNRAAAQAQASETLLDNSAKFIRELDGQSREITTIQAELAEAERGAREFYEALSSGAENATEFNFKLFEELQNTIGALKEELRLAKEINKEFEENIGFVIAGAFGVTGSFITPEQVRKFESRVEKTFKRAGKKAASAWQIGLAEAEAGESLFGELLDQSALEAGRALDQADPAEFVESFVKAFDATLFEPIKVPFVPTLPEDATEAFLEDTSLRLIDRFSMLKDEILPGFSDAVAGSFGILFDNISEGDRLLDGVGEGFAKLSSDFLKATGEQLIADGAFNILKGTGLSILGNLAQGPPLIALGGVEIASGLALGATGGAIGRGAQSAETSAGVPGGTGSGSRGNNLGESARDERGPNIVLQYFNGGAPGSTTFVTGGGEDPRIAAGRFIEEVRTEAQRAGGSGFARRAA